MLKSCPKCSKSVYPTEELRAMDHSWHKLCFKCTTCEMSLNVKNYSAFDKRPYCRAHLPTVKHTAVADNPEMIRARKAQESVSNVAYHKNFEESKGTKLSVVDDPESRRLQLNTQNISAANYTGHTNKRDEQESRRPTQREIDTTNTTIISRGAGSVFEYDPLEQQMQAMGHMSINSRDSNVIHRASDVQPQRFQPGSIADYDPVEGNYGSTGRAAAARTSSTSSARSSQQGGFTPQQPQPQQNYPPKQQQPQNAGYNQQQSYGGSPRQSQSYQQPQPAYTQPAQPQQPAYSPQQPAYNQQPAYTPQPQPAYTPQPQATYTPQPQAAYAPQPPPPQQKAVIFVALYDYSAAEEDECSFNEGDRIINVQSIDEGWSTGIVERTGKNGMIPANYIEPMY